MANKSKENEILQKVLKYLSKNSSKTVPIKDVEKPKTTPIKDRNETNSKNNETRNYRAEAARLSTRKREDNLNLVPIKNVEKPKTVPIKDVEKPKTVPIKNVMQAYPLDNGKTRFHDGNGNSWDVNIKNKVKYNNWKLEEISDGIAHIKYPNGTTDQIYLRGK